MLNRVCVGRWGIIGLLCVLADHAPTACSERAVSQLVFSAVGEEWRIRPCIVV